MLISFTGLVSAQETGKHVSLKGKVTSNYTTDPLLSVTVKLIQGSREYKTLTNESGEYIFKKLPAGTYQLSFSSVNVYAKESELTLSTDKVFNIGLEPMKRMLNEVYVTASEARGKSSTSVIDRKAMQLLQPSSFTDLLELLPGGRAIDPKLTQMNQIRLREPSNATEGYDVSSLGVAFYIDGAPINTTANMQSLSAFLNNSTDPNGSRDNTNRGVDMRSLSTDQIEKVEIVRGIPSVEYGDLTSGLVNIQRKKGSTPYTARIKTDGFSKLFSMGKGVSILEKNLYVNADFGFLDAKSDPTNNFKNYKRINSSVRTEKFWENDKRTLTWNLAVDYATTVDNQHTDPDNSYALTDNYKSTYKSYGLTNSLKFKFHQHKFIKSLDFSSKISRQRDFIDVTRWVQAKSATILVNSLVEGERDAIFITPSYAAKHQTDGKPLNVFLKASSVMAFKTGVVSHSIKTGIESNYSKNSGMGQIYDLDYPMNTTNTARPRTFQSIPAMQKLSLYAEDQLNFSKGTHHFAITAGIRGMASLGMDKQYLIANKPYIDPRINARWSIPAIFIGTNKLNIDFGGGYGLHTMLPTLDQLYPGNFYKDLVQLNFYHNNPDFRRANAMTYIINPVNYDLAPAVNRKWELNTDITYEGNRLSITYFRERMRSGFREINNYRAFSYKKYDNASIDASNLTQKPEISDFKYEDQKEFYSYSINSNGSALIKEGIEYQFTSKRISSINTRFTLQGAWYKASYLNSVPTYNVIPLEAITDNKVRQYVGIYAEDQGNDKQQLNTNLIIDSYLPSIGIMISASVQSLWFLSRKAAYNSGTPFQYIDVNGNIHPYTEESKVDINLQWLNKPISVTNFRKYTTPLDLQANLKASKQFRNKATMAMFVNRIITYRPDYMSYGTWQVRERMGPYFGMELTLNL